MNRRDVELINEVTGAGIRIPEGTKEVNMCVAIREMEKEAADMAADKRIVDAIKNLMKTTNWTSEQAMKALGVSVEEQSRVMKML